MTSFTLKPITGTAIYVIYALVSYEENRGLNGSLAFEEVCSGYLVFAGRDALYFAQTLEDAKAFVEQKVADFCARMRETQEQREQAILARPGGPSHV